MYVAHFDITLRPVHGRNDRHIAVVADVVCDLGTHPRREGGGGVEEYVHHAPLSGEPNRSGSPTQVHAVTVAILLTDARGAALAERTFAARRQVDADDPVVVARAMGLALREVATRIASAVAELIEE